MLGFILVKAMKRSKDIIEVEKSINTNCYCWDKYVTKVIVYETSGDHYTLFHEPNISNIGAILKQIL